MPKERVVRAMVGDAAPAARERRRVAAGECVGLAGLAGSGKSEIGDAIAGLVAPIGGQILVSGADLRGGDVTDARRKGVGYVPRDRHARGIVPLLSIAENMTMTIVERLGPAGGVLPARPGETPPRPGALPQN